jgi:hypothetical protein
MVVHDLRQSQTVSGKCQLIDEADVKALYIYLENLKKNVMGIEMILAAFGKDYYKDDEEAIGIT